MIVVEFVDFLLILAVLIVKHLETIALLVNNFRKISIIFFLIRHKSVGKVHARIPYALHNEMVANQPGEYLLYVQKALAISRKRLNFVNEWIRLNKRDILLNNIM